MFIFSAMRNILLSTSLPPYIPKWRLDIGSPYVCLVVILGLAKSMRLYLQ